MAYEKTNWVNGETPISAENLNKMEQGIEEAGKTGGILEGTIVAYDGDTIPEGYEEVDNPNVYSTEEKVIGEWIDGKPLYRRVIVVTDLVKDGSEQIVKIIPNIREVRSVVGTQTTSGGMTSNMPLLWGDNVSSRNSMVWADVQTAQTYVKYKVNSGWTSLSKITITIEYTKTTD